MKKLTREEAIKEHRKMWTWIAEETLKQKRKVIKAEYFSHFGIEDIPEADCYLCEYTYQEKRKAKNRYRQHCYFCPLCWGVAGDKSFFASCIFHHYGKWENIKQKDIYRYEEAVRLAREIANLPERKGE